MHPTCAAGCSPVTFSFSAAWQGGDFELGDGRGGEAISADVLLTFAWVGFKLTEFVPF